MKGAESHLNLVQIYENFLQKVVSGWAQYNSNILHASLWEDRSWKKNRGVFDTGYIVAVVTKSTTGNRWLSIFRQQYIQKADLEWSVKVNGL